jgi:hypothetical protein
MARRFAIYDAGGTPVLLLTGRESDAIANTPAGGARVEVGFEISRLQDAPPAPQVGSEP